MKYLYFTGDRKSKTIAIGKFLAKFFKRVVVILWDGDKSKIYIDNVSPK